MESKDRRAISIIVMDVSFISATLVLPAVVERARDSQPEGGVELVLLVKPQFGKGGIVRDAEAQQMAVERTRSAVLALSGSGIEVIDSPILGAEGNREFLLHARFR